MDEHADINQPSLQEALGAYERADCARFHMPGHKGRGMAGFWRDALVCWDVTELSGTDNLHAPSGAIERAQREMAAAYGAESSFFVVNGSTAAVQAMILSLMPEDKLLLSRDCHKSAIAGAALRGLETDFYWPAYDCETLLPGMITPEALERELVRTGASAVLVTTPNIYGLCADAARLAEAAHAHGALLLVDAAHGAHFPFSEALPAGLGGVADLFAHSQHKTMDALTQAASLHLGRCRIDADRVRRALALVETTSPSYLLMSSLDWSVFMARRRNWTAQVARCAALERRIEQIDGLRVLRGIADTGAVTRDQTRVVIDVSGRGLGGYEAQAHLEQNGVFIEMADSRRLVLITSPCDEPVWYERLLGALRTLSKGERALFGGASMPAEHPERRMTLREAMFAGVERVPLAAAAGRVAAEAVGVYPPGIALLAPGEVFSARAVDDLLEQQRQGGALFGVRDGRVFVTTERGKA